jgi:hypothetical protein
VRLAHRDNKREGKKKKKKKRGRLPPKIAKRKLLQWIHPGGIEQFQFHGALAPVNAVYRLLFCQLSVGDEYVSRLRRMV